MTVTEVAAARAEDQRITRQGIRAICAGVRRAALACVVAAGSPSPAQTANHRPPNVVLLLADDLGYGELGCYGQVKIRTPHIDRLAAEGMRFLRHYAGAPVCAPSRCVLMTGKHPGHAAVRDNREAPKGEGQLPLPAGEVTLAEVLHQAGYATGAFGKWGLGTPGTEGDPQRQGFEQFFGYYCQRHAHSHWPGHLYGDGQPVKLTNDPPVPGAGKLADPSDAAGFARFVGTDYAPDRIVEQALAFLRANRERPFFCYLPSTLPHLALHVPAADAKAYAFPETPYLGQQGYTPHLTPRAAYAAMITRLDDHVGQVLGALDALELAEHTIVVLTSDNGATHSPVGGTDVEFFASCGGLRGRKGSLHEGGVRVPGIVRWPGVVKAGSACEQVTGFEDWLPTLAEACGAERPAVIDGISLLPHLRGEAGGAPRLLYREFSGYGGWQALWQGRWKIVRSGLRQRASSFSLYDLDSDPGEVHDVAEEQPEVVARLAEWGRQQRVASATFPLAGLDDAGK